MTWEIALVFSMVGVAFSMFYLANSLDQRHYGIKLLLLLVGLFLLVGNLGINSQIIEANNDTINETIVGNLQTVTDTSYNGLIWVSVFVVLYFILYWIMQLIKSMKINKKYAD